MTNEIIYLFNDFTLDLARGCLTQNGAPIHLRPQTYEVLRYLAANSGRLISKDQLIETVWQGRAVTDGSLGKCIEEIREALGVEGREYVRNVRGRGYIFDTKNGLNEHVASKRSEEIEFVSVVVEETNESTNSARRTPERQISRSKRVVEATLLLLPLVLLPAYLYGVSRWKTPSRIESVAVLPLSNDSGNPEFDYLSDGMTDTLISTLARIPGLSVKSRSSVLRYKGKNVEPQQVASELKVQAVLNGRVAQHGDDVSLYVSLVDAKTGNELWGEQYKRKAKDIVFLQSDVANDVSRGLHINLTSTEKEQLTKGTTQNNDAYQAYLKARFYWSKPGRTEYLKSRDFFQEAVDRDPNYAIAFAGMAHYYGFAAATGVFPPDENWPKSESALTKAMAIDDSVAESYNALAGIQLYYHRDWPAAERSFRRGIELNPESAEVHHHYGRCLNLFGRNEEAIRELKRTVELEPLSLRYQLSLAIALYNIGDYDQAIDQIRKTLELEPNYAPARDWLGNLYERKNNQREAIAEWSRALVLSRQSETAKLLEQTYASSGFDNAVRALAQTRLETLKESEKQDGYVAAREYVTVYKRLGKKDLAYEWLERALQERNRFAFEVRVDPFYDDFRKEARFQNLLRRYGFA